MDQMIHACKLCVFPCNINHFSINIVALNIRLYIQIDQILCFVRRTIPAFPIDKMSPLFCGELPVHAGRHIRRHHRCFDRDRAASAERVYQNPIRFPGRQHNQRRCKILRDRSLRRQLAIASFM